MVLEIASYIAGFSNNNLGLSSIIQKVIMGDPVNSSSLYSGCLSTESKIEESF